jgi:hypothetical protein
VVVDDKGEGEGEGEDGGDPEGELDVEDTDDRRTRVVRGGEAIVACEWRQRPSGRASRRRAVAELVVDDVAPGVMARRMVALATGSMTAKQMA